MTYFLLHKLTRFCYNFKGLLTQVNTPVKVSLIYKSRIILLFCRTFTAIRIIWQETDFLHVGCSRLRPDSSARHQWANRPSVAEKALLTCFWPGLPTYEMEDEKEEEEEEVEKGAPTVITSNCTDPVRPLDETPAPPFPFVSHIQPLPRISWNWIEILTLCQPSTQHWQVFFGHVEWILESEKMYNNYNYHLIIIM